MKYSVCTDAVYAGRDLLTACREVLRLGFEAVEFWLPEGKDIDGLVALQEETGLKVALLCTDFIPLTDASCLAEYTRGLEKAVQTAKRLGCGVIVSQTGPELGFDRAVQHKNIVHALRSFAPMLEDNGITYVLEPLNVRVDHPGYYLRSSDECAEILDEVGSPAAKMLFDVYHQQITEGDIIRRIRQYAPYIGHFHAAGNPGRHELYSSELDYKTVFRAIEDTGYEGYVGLEYFPEDEPEKGLRYAMSIKP